MFRRCSVEDHERESEGGTRHLFALGGYEFQDTMDGEGRLHHFVLEAAGGEEEDRIYEADQATMYEFMARFLAGEYEKQAYEMERSPAHEALLDLLEMAAARARAGDSEFSLDQLEEVELDEEEEEGSS